MENNKRRKLVRHVDGRIMIGRMPWKNFVIVLFISLIILAINIKLYRLTEVPFVYMLGVITIGIIAMLFSEINNKEIGLDMIRSLIKYKVEGDLIYERGTKSTQSTRTRCTWNKIEGKETYTDF